MLLTFTVYMLFVGIAGLIFGAFVPAVVLGFVVGLVALHPVFAVGLVALVVAAIWAGQAAKA